MSLTFEAFNLTLQYHDDINRLIWDEDDQMKPLVRDVLMKIAGAWQEFAHIPTSAIKDIVVTGGNANYNYTPMSDIDIHLLVDMRKISKDKDLVDDYLFDKKALWALQHPDIRVLGYPVELYAQNHDEKASNQGIYSIKNDKWIQKPKKTAVNFNADKGLKRKVKEYMKTINQLIKSDGDNTQQISALKTKFRLMRGAGIARAGEFSYENLLYKELRNRGYIDKMNKYLEKIRAREYSLYPSEKTS